MKKPEVGKARCYDTEVRKRRKMLNRERGKEMLKERKKGE